MSKTKAVVKETTQLTVSKETIELQGKLVDLIEITESGGLKENEKLHTAFIDTAPAEVKKAYEAVQNHESHFATALLGAFGEKAVPFIAGHRDINRVHGIVKTGKTELALNYVAPSGKKNDGTPKDPAVSVIYRRQEHADHTAIRHGINAKTRELID